MSLREDSVVKSTCCSCRVPRFKSQNPYGGSKPSIIQVSGNPTGMRIMHAGRQSIHTHSVKVNKSNKLTD